MKARKIVLAAAILISLALLAAGISYLRSERFQARARAAIIARIEQSTGLSVGLERFSLNVLRGRFLITRLELKPRQEGGSRFHLAVDEVSGSIRLSALWRPKIDLAELNLIRPKLTIVQAPGVPPTPMEPIITGALVVAARKATIQDGWVELNYRHIPLDLAMDSLDCSIQYRARPESYSVNVAYKNSPLLWPPRRFVYDLRAAVEILPSGMHIDSFEIREGSTLLKGVGVMSGWDKPMLRFHVEGTLGSGELALLTPDLKDARGDAALEAECELDTSGFRSTGQFKVPKAGYRQSVAHDIAGLFEIKDEVLWLRGVHGRIGGGTFQAEGSVQLRESAPKPNHVELSGKDIVIRDTSGLLDLGSLLLENSADGRVVLEWRKKDDLDAQGAVTLHGLAEPSGEGAMRTALQGTAEFSFHRGAWHVKSASLVSPDTRVEALGPDPAKLHVLLDTDDPAEVFRLLRGLSPAFAKMLLDKPDLMSLAGRFHLNGDILGVLPDATAYDGQVSLANARWRSYGLDSLSGTAYWDGSRLRMRAFRLRKGAQSAEGDITLDLFPGKSIPDLAFNGTIQKVSLEGLADLGVDLKAQVKGFVSGRGRMTYGQGRLQGDGQFQIDNGSFNGEAFDLLSAAVQVKGRELQITDGQVTRGSAAVAAQGLVDLETKTMNLSARLRELPIQEIPEVRASGLAIDGRITASGEIRGTPEQPQFTGNVDLTGLVYAGWNLGKGQATIDLRDKVLSAKFDVQSELGGFQGDVRLITEPGYPGKASVEFRDWNVKKIIAGSAPALFNDFSTALRGSLVIEGPFAELSKLQYRGELDGARFKINGYELHNEGMMRFALQNQRLVVEEARLVGEGSSLALEKNGVIQLGKDPTINLHLSGKLNLGFLDRLAEKVGVSGAAALDVRASGSLRSPEVIGSATLDAAHVDYEDFPYTLSGLRGNIIFSSSSIKLEAVTGAIASGTIQLNGSIEHQSGQLRGMNLQGSLRGARLRYPKDFVSTVDAELNLRGGADTQALTGDVTVLRAEYLRDFSVLEQILSRPPNTSAPQSIDPLLTGVRLNVSVHSQDGLYIDNELTRLQGGMDLTLQGTLAYPSVRGRVNANEGTIFFRGNRFDIIHATADFVDRNRINPIFDIRAEADVRSYRLRLDATGDLEHLRLNVTSDPPLSTVDIVSLLTTGNSEVTATTGTENPRRQAEMTGLSAASILSEQVIGKRVERIFGLQSFRVDPFLAGAENDPTARVTISERLSKDLAVTFSRNLSTNQEQIVVIEYDVSRNLSIVATRAEDGTYGVDFRFRKRLR